MHGTLVGAVVEIKCRWCSKKRGREVTHRWRILKHRAVLLPDDDDQALGWLSVTDQSPGSP
jgi:hypothetical protein